MGSIIRLPAMMSEFWRILRSRESDKTYSMHQKQAIKQMVDWKITDEVSQATFLNDRCTALERIGQMQQTDVSPDFHRTTLKAELSEFKAHAKETKPQNRQFHSSARRILRTEVDQSPYPPFTSSPVNAS